MSSASGKRRGLPACYVRPMLRLVEVKSLVLWRRAHGRYTSPQAAMTVAGHALANLEGMRLRAQPPHPGLDILTAERFLSQAQIDMTDTDTMVIVAEVHQSRNCPHPFVMTDVIAGSLLMLEREERTGLGITTIEAADEAPDARRARKAEEKRERDRERQRSRRRSAGVKPKSVQPVEHERPWEALGISRRTWFYRQSRRPDDDCTSASRTSMHCTSASRTSLEERARRGSANSNAAHHVEMAAAAQRTASPAADRAAEIVLRLLGKGDPSEGRSLAALIDPDRLKTWIEAVDGGTLAGDARLDLEIVAIKARQSMRAAS